MSREMGIRSEIASFLHNLGYVAHRQGDHRRAAALFGESLARFRDAGDKRGVAFCLIGSAGVAGATRQPERAARLLGAAESLLEAIGARIWPSNRADYDRIVAAARAGLDDVAFNAAWEEGRAMSPEEAVEYALNPRG
jgi:hypothetical protein